MHVNSSLPKGQVALTSYLTGAMSCWSLVNDDFVRRLLFGNFAEL